ncbi:MAG: thioredoxin family protein [Deltaproteobacteria bacterium]|nr:thioredoxin family protein [Deltaproteobacteria bacterium]
MFATPFSSPGAAGPTNCVKTLFFLALAFISTYPLSAQLVREEKARVELLEDRDSYAPGSTARLSVMMSIEEGWHVNAHEPTLDFLIPTEATFELPIGWSSPEVEYPEGVLLPFEFADVPISVYEGRVALLTNLKVPENASGGIPVRVNVRYQACDDAQCLPPVTSSAETILSVGESGNAIHLDAFSPQSISTHGAVAASKDPSSGQPPTETVPGDKPAGVPSTPGRGLLGFLVMGVLGGLILNVMPCVLPVLSLKVFGLVKSASQGRGEAARGGIMTSLGILSSFWALALAAVVAKGAGRAVGWGVQFQQPGFVVFLTVIVLLFSLNLWGLFEIPLPARLANRLAGGGAPREGAAGHFASGLFATLMATPCSAPFLGTAISFALGQSALEIFAIFTAVGLGMSLPYLLLAAWPKAGEFLPKPGPWMETVRGAMGFLLAAAAIWLFFVLAGQISSARVALIQLALLSLCLCVWIASRRSGVAKVLKTLAAVGAVGAAAWSISLAVTAEPVERGQSAIASQLIPWIEFDQAQAKGLASEGKMVFVDVTADWCLTCKVNEKAVLETPEVAGAFERLGIVAMKADWTNYNEEIGDFLQLHGRSGIPFYLLYRPGREPYLFGELLTKDKVLNALAEGS